MSHIEAGMNFYVFRVYSYHRSFPVKQTRSGQIAYAS